MSDKHELEFPQQVPVDPTKGNEAIFVHPKEGIYAPQAIGASFEAMDDAYIQDRHGWLKAMQAGVRQIRVQRRPWAKPKVDISLIDKEQNLGSEELLVVMSPLNDGRPHSSAERITDFIDKKDPSFYDIQKAKPNSWNPATKLDIGYEFLHNQGLGMPVLQVYNRIAPRTFTLTERKQIMGGNLAPYARVVRAAIAHANQARHEKFGTGPFTEAHFFGAGLGHVALIVANEMVKNQDGIDVVSGTAMNLIMGKDTRRQAILEYSVNPYEGEAAEFTLPPGYQRVNEPRIRRDIDGKGTELSMRLRQVPPLLDFGLSRPLIKSTPYTAGAVNGLVGSGRVVTIANSFNSSLVSKTKDFLPLGHPNLYISDIVGIEGYKTMMMSNEHSALVGVVMALGIRNAREHQHQAR